MRKNWKFNKQWWHESWGGKAFQWGHHAQSPRDAKQLERSRWILGRLESMTWGWPAAGRGAGHGERGTCTWSLYSCFQPITGYSTGNGDAPQHCFVSTTIKLVEPMGQKWWHTVMGSMDWTRFIKRGTSTLVGLHSRQESLAVVLCKYLVYLFLFGVSSSVKQGWQHYLRHRTALIDWTTAVSTGPRKLNKPTWRGAFILHSREYPATKYF